MKINWKIRIKNKAWLLAIVGAIISLAYQIMELAGYTPTIPQEKLLDIVTAALTILSLLGIVIDPTTEGIEDSDRAMTYGSEEEDDDQEAEEGEEPEA